MVILTEALLYPSLALLLGGLILYAIPAQRRPAIHLPKPLLAGSALMVGLLSFSPVYTIVRFLAEASGFWATMKEVLFGFQVGQAWWFTLAISMVLFLMISFNDLSQNPRLARIGVGWAGVLLLLMGWASHAASQAPAAGFVAHSLHVAAVCTWSGILLVVGWFSSRATDWGKFLEWFTPVAISCVLVLIVAGLGLMQIIVPQYVNSWLLPYGQALLLKHLLMVPLLWFAFINGFRRRARWQQDPNWNPLTGVRAEGMYILLIFIATAIMGQQTPPHEVAETMRTEPPSPLFAWLTGTVPDLPAQWAFTPINGLTAVLALLFLGSLLMAERRRISASGMWGMGIGFVIAGFLTVLTALT